MSKNKAGWYEVVNINAPNCCLTRGLNELYGLQTFQQEKLQVPEPMGTGFWERIQVSASVEILICELSFHEAMVIGSKEEDDHIKWSFCLGEPIEWMLEHSSQNYYLESGETSVFGRHLTSSIGYFQANRQYRGITIKQDPNYLNALHGHSGR